MEEDSENNGESREGIKEGERDRKRRENSFEQTNE